MPREYRHIQEYEKEILELRAQGKTGREIREKFVFSKSNMTILSHGTTAPSMSSRGTPYNNALAEIFS